MTVTTSCVQGGPGTVDATVEALCRSLFLAHGGLGLERCLPLATPLSLRVQMLTDIMKNKAGMPVFHR
jgi:hypothetical protein